MTKSKSKTFVLSGEIPWVTMAAGLKRQILGYDDQLMMVRVLFDRGAVGALHSHSHRQVSFVESGKFEIEIAGEMQMLTAGDSFFVPPDMPHKAVALEPGCLVDVFAPARENFLAM